MKLIGHLNGVPLYEEKSVPEGELYVLNSDDLEVEGSKEQ